MTAKLREQISALADDELPAGEHELLAYRFSFEKNISNSWERYHLIGEAMRKALPQVDSRGFADRIMMELKDEAALTKKHTPVLDGYFKRTAVGMVLAGCVAMVAILGLRHGDGMHVQSITAPSDIVPPAVSIQASPVSYGMSSNAAWNGNTPEVQAELNNYVINHNEVATAIEQQSMSPYFYIYSVRKGQASKQSQTPRHTRQQDKR